MLPEWSGLRDRSDISLSGWPAEGLGFDITLFIGLGHDPDMVMPVSDSRSRAVAPLPPCA